jgi:hypothetical protein
VIVFNCIFSCGTFEKTKILKKASAKERAAQKKEEKKSKVLASFVSLVIQCMTC